jgi:hypothetical protein
MADNLAPRLFQPASLRVIIIKIRQKALRGFEKAGIWGKFIWLTILKVEKYFSDKERTKCYRQRV